MTSEQTHILELIRDYEAYRELIRGVISSTNRSDYEHFQRVLQFCTNKINDLKQQLNSSL